MLKGTNIRIRPLEKEDLDCFYLWLQDQTHLGEFMDMQMVYKEQFFELFSKSIGNPSRFYAIIEDKEGNPLGEINFIRVLGSSTTLEIGLLIAEKSARGKGIGTESLRLFVNYLFKTQNIMRIQYKTRVDNIGMKKIGEKIGFQQEAILKKYEFVQGDYRDFYLMAITRDDWKLDE